MVLITFDVAFSGSLPPALMVTAAGGIFILPFFLFSALAGQLGDRVDKAGMIRWVKLLEIIVMLLALPGFLLESADYLMLVLFLMGTQSAFFGPLKYGILPEHLSTAELPAGNAWIEAATFLAILGGTVLANLLILEKGGTILIADLVITLAVLGNVTALAIPKAPPVPPSNPLPALQWNIFKGTAALVGMIREGRAPLWLYSGDLLVLGGGRHVPDPVPHLHQSRSPRERGCLYPASVQLFSGYCPGVPDLRTHHARTHDPETCDPWCFGHDSRHCRSGLGQQSFLLPKRPQNGYRPVPEQLAKPPRCFRSDCDRSLWRTLCCPRSMPSCKGKAPGTKGHRPLPAPTS